MANQCIHCPFVSRDRSENSTLLLRHLLSPACHAPEDVRSALKAARGVNKTKRKSAESKAAAAAAGNHPLIFAIIRFFLAHNVDFAAVESPFWTELVHALRPNPPQKLSNPNLPPRPTHFLPSIAAVEAALRNASPAQLIPSPTVAQPKQLQYPTSTQLIIYFPFLPDPKQHRLLHMYNHANGIDPHRHASYVASAFSLSSSTSLKYIASRNCRPDFQASLADLVDEASQASALKFDHIVIARPVCDLHNPRPIPKTHTHLVWIPDVSREVEIMSQELLAKVPLLVRCQRRNRLLATFFREDYSQGAAVTLFGRNLSEKEQCQRYLAHLSNFPQNPSCYHIVQNALQTYEILLQTQTSHDDPHRMNDVGTFMQQLTEENCGNPQLCKEVVRLLLNTQYRKDLKAFLSFMTPFSNLILRYGTQQVSDSKHLFDSPPQFTTRSVAHVLPDCFETMWHLYLEKIPEYEADLCMVRDLATHRLVKGVDHFPPVIAELCYIAACLNPCGDLGALKGLMAPGEVWKRALKFIETHYGDQGGPINDRIVSQLQEFQGRQGRFAVPELFSDTGDPCAWWTRNAGVAPELAGVAIRVLSVPTTAFPVVKFVSEANAKDDDLRGGERDAYLHKRRCAVWNLRLRLGG